MKINSIIESQKVLEYLTKRKLLKQYKKSKILLLSGFTKNLDFKLREPKKNNIYYFRINKQYRALGYFNGNNFYIVKVDNHQN